MVTASLKQQHSNHDIEAGMKKRSPVGTWKLRRQEF